MAWRGGLTSFSESSEGKAVDHGEQHGFASQCFAPHRNFSIKIPIFEQTGSVLVFAARNVKACLFSIVLSSMGCLGGILARIPPGTPNLLEKYLCQNRPKKLLTHSKRTLSQFFDFRLRNKEPTETSACLWNSHIRRKSWVAELALSWLQFQFRIWGGAKNFRLTLKKECSVET